MRSRKNSPIAQRRFSTINWYVKSPRNQNTPNLGSNLDRKGREKPLSFEDQRKIADIEKAQDQIKRLVGGDYYGTDQHNKEVERVLYNYITKCNNISQEFLEDSNIRVARRILNQCQEFVQNQCPDAISSLILKRGIMHAVWNNLAQHCNMTNDMHQSIEFLEKAVEVAEDPQIND